VAIGIFYSPAFKASAPESTGGFFRRHDGRNLSEGRFGTPQIHSQHSDFARTGSEQKKIAKFRLLAEHRKNQVGDHEL
jgi:hypothetical protein